MVILATISGVIRQGVAITSLNYSNVTLILLTQFKSLANFCLKIIFAINSTDTNEYSVF